MKKSTVETVSEFISRHNVSKTKFAERHGIYKQEITKFYADK
jgi:hypothetical protein